jgi:predicted RNase H-like HicB family nuclease
MEHSKNGLSLINMLKARKLSCEGSYTDLVNILANYKGTWEEILDIALILKETINSTNLYFIREKEFIDDLAKYKVFTGSAMTTLMRLDEFLKTNKKSREDLLKDIRKKPDDDEIVFPDTPYTYTVGMETNYLDFIEYLKKFKKNPKSKDTVLTLIHLLNCDYDWTDGGLKEGLMPFLHKLVKGVNCSLPEFTDLYKGAGKTKKEAMADIKKALDIPTVKSNKEKLYELIESLTMEDFTIPEDTDTIDCIDDNKRDFAQAAEDINKELLLKSFRNLHTPEHTCELNKEHLKGYLYTLCHVGAKRELKYILDCDHLSQRVVKKPEEITSSLWLSSGYLDPKYFDTYEFIYKAHNIINAAPLKPDPANFVKHLWMLWYYKNTKEENLDKLMDTLLNLYKEFGTIQQFSVCSVNIEPDIKDFMGILDGTSNGVVLRDRFSRYLEIVKPDLMDIPEEVLKHIISMNRKQKVEDVLKDLRSTCVDKIAGAIEQCVNTSSPEGRLEADHKIFISSYSERNLSAEGYSGKLANFIREINNPEGLKKIFKTIDYYSNSMRQVGLREEYDLWKKGEEDVKKVLEKESVKKEEEFAVITHIVNSIPPAEVVTVKDVLYKDVLYEAPPKEVLAEKDPSPAEPEKPSENQKRIEDYKHGLYLGVIKESISSLRKIISDMYIKDKTIVELLNTSVGDALLSALLVELIPFILGESHKDKVDFIVKLLKENSMFLLGEMAMKVIFGAGKELSRLKENIEVLSLLKEAVAA